MHMPPTLTRRMQVLLDDERYERLASRAETTGSSIAPSYGTRSTSRIHGHD